MVGQELALIPGIYGILLCNIWPEKGHLLLWGFPVGRSIGYVHGTCAQAGCRGGAVGQPWSCSTAELCWSSSPLLSSPGDSLPCPAFQLLHTGVQGVTCSLKVAQAKHKPQILTIALTEHEKSLLKCVWGGVVRGFFKAQMH